METQAKILICYILIAIIAELPAQSVTCPQSDTIQPCICTNRDDDVQIWCTHSELTQVIKGVQKVGDHIKKPIDELIIENNYLPSLPGKVFQNVKILRLMLRHNGLERLSLTWLETQEMNIVEIFMVEHELKSIPPESLNKLKNLQALTIQSHNLKRIPPLINLSKLKYVSIQTHSLSAFNEHTFDNLPSLERLYVQGSPHLRVIKENALYNLPRLKKLSIVNCGLNYIHMRGLSLLPALKELLLNNNKITDAGIVSRATRDLQELTVLGLENNLIDKLNEGAFVDLPNLQRLTLSKNNINIIQHGAFHRVPKLRVVDLSYNKISRIHPESFLQQSGSGVEELNLIGNQITHISEFKALLEALPRLKFLDLSENLLDEIPKGALRGHPNLERLHINRNSIKFIQADAFVAMPALRELHLSNNSLADTTEGPFWNLPSLKGLDLSNNYFQRLLPKMLYNLPALRRINVSNNRLTMIDPITFIESPLLEFINISENTLVTIHPATFRNLVNLYEIDARANKIIEFIPGLPRGLEELYLNKNQITSLPTPPSPDLDLPSLRMLDLSNNGIQNIPVGGLKSLHNLRRLYISRNGLRQIDITTFNDLEQLEILDLGENQIISIHPKSFNKLTHLKKVNLRGNTIENFDFISIQDNTALFVLDFSKNKLKTISPNTIRTDLDVEIFNISSNNLKELPPTLNMLPKLKVLDASFNKIKQFDGNTVNGIQTLKEINLLHNKITELPTGSFKNINDLEMINLDNNQIEIIQPMAIANLPNLVTLYLSRNHIVDLPERVFFNLPKLKVIDLQGNRLQFISHLAFENIPLVQYLNLSNNQLTSVDNTGLRQLMSLEVLDLSFNKLSKITRASFQYMEWLIELNLDNNLICYITGQPFDSMPRLKVLSLRNNKLSFVSEEAFAKLRNNIAILDIDGNPLICNCKIIWLKSWLLESTSIGPKCLDGTYVKGMPFSFKDCSNIKINEKDLDECIIQENEALLPSLATSQVFSSLDKIKDFATQIKNNYQNNKIINKPSPEESEYFYDDYIDYPYNETLLDNLHNEVNLKPGTLITSKQKNTILNKTNTNPVKITASNSAKSGFTFFGMPLPSIDMGKFLNTGRKVDWVDQHNKHREELPKFETGGFSPIYPTTSGGFKPIINPNISHTNMEDKENFSKHVEQGSSVSLEATKPSLKVVQNNTVTHQKTKSEIHEIQAFLDDDNSTHLAYNRTKNIEEQKVDPNKMSKYNLVESNLTITQITEKEPMLITTDSSNEISIAFQAWSESSTISYSSPTITTSKSQIKKHITESTEPTALSAILIPNSEELIRKESIVRPATVTKVIIPQFEHKEYDNYAPVINREGKTRFSELSNTKARGADDKDWYYKNYNNSKLKPYVAPDIMISSSSNTLFTCSLLGMFLIVVL